MVSIFVAYVSDCAVYADTTPAGNDPMQTTTAWLDRFFGMVRLSHGPFNSLSGLIHNGS